VIRFLIDSGVPVNETDANGVTPLHRAVRFRSIGAVDLLLKLGADVHATDRKSHSTPLHRAVTNTGAPATAGKHDLAVRIAESLLSHGADPGARNKNGKTPAEYARTPDMKAVFKH
jgi:tankyrase